MPRIYRAITSSTSGKADVGPKTNKAETPTLETKAPTKPHVKENEKKDAVAGA